MRFKFIIFLFLVLSVTIRSESLLLGTSIFYCLYYIKVDFWPFQVNRLDISSVYPIGFLLNTISHFIAINSTNPSAVENYFLMYIPEYLFEGLAIFQIGSMVIMESMRYYVKPRNLNRSEVLSMLRLNWNLMFSSALIFFLISELTSVGSFGAVGTILNLFVQGSILYLSLNAHFYDREFKINVLLLFVSFLSLWSLRYSYLRYEIILPWVSYFLGEAIARKRLLAFNAKSKIVLVTLMLVIPPVFTYLGKYRSEISGRSDKISLIISGSQQEEELENGQTIMSRLSYINQLTHVVGLTKHNGFYNGETLHYFSYVFIPRFLWPNKPTVQQGQWFALESGLAYQLKSGKANNSINMTVPGEFYLNFGWLGVLIGCWIFGWFVVFVWHGILGNNLPSWGLQFYLLFGSLAGLGADLQIVVTMLAYYLIYKAYAFFVVSKQDRVLVATNVYQKRI